jgi:hypothetical protein
VPALHHLGYSIGPDGMRACCQQGRWQELPSFSLNGVELDRVVAARLDLNVDLYHDEPLRLRRNGAQWHSYPLRVEFRWGTWRALSPPVDLADLHPGANTFELGSDDEAVVANIDLSLELRQPCCQRSRSGADFGRVGL